MAKVFMAEGMATRRRHALGVVPEGAPALKPSDAARGDHGSAS